MVFCFCFLFVLFSLVYFFLFLFFLFLFFFFLFLSSLFSLVVNVNTGAPHPLHTGRGFVNVGILTVDFVG